MLSHDITGKKLRLVILDLLIINLSYLLTLVFRLGINIPQENFDAYLRIAPWVSIVSVLIFFLCDLYNNWIHYELVKVLSLITAAVVLSTIATMGIIYLSHSLAMPRTVTVLNSVLELFLLASARLLIWSLQKKFDGRKKTVIIGENENDIKAIVNDFLNIDKNRYIISDTYSINDLSELALIIRNNDCEVIAMRAQLARDEEIINLCIKEHKEILIIPDIMAILLHSAETEVFDDKLFFSLKPLGIPQVKKVLKRAFDIVCSGILLLILAPVIILIAVIIPLTSHGSAFFRQERLGENGKRFDLIKFRSMVSNAEEETGPVLAVQNDPRITRFGTFLRNSRLDEVPQLINVLKGDMSLVGPRPEREFFINQYLETIPYYSYRMDVKPGITGLAQVMGRYNSSPEDKLRFDLMYIRNYSLLLDLHILLLTAKVVFHLDKADGVKIEYNDTSEKIVS